MVWTIYIRLVSIKFESYITKCIFPLFCIYFGGTYGRFGKLYLSIDIL